MQAILFYPFPPRPKTRAEQQRMWARVILAYEKWVAAAEKSKVKIATHGHCEPWYLLWNFHTIKRLLDAIPSPYNGWTYDPGILYLTDSDMFAPIELVIDRIAFAHARDVIGNWQKFDEVFLGEGVVDFAKVLRKLHEAGYDGVIAPEHLGPAKPGENLEAKAVAYLKQQLSQMTAG